MTESSLSVTRVRQQHGFPARALRASPRRRPCLSERQGGEGRQAAADRRQGERHAVKFKPETCHTKARNLDTVRVHYKGMLVDGSVFDSSYERGDPLQFRLGQGNVIKGWDIGILGMCVGEKRKLKIPPHMGYGESGSPPKIPGGATLIFETELVEIVGAKPDDDEL
ncbi:unnamed protein product [Closterium sp. Yama58-4]|nr:unnamed protein product [Closterium sp. Yama58-4]